MKRRTLAGAALLLALAVSGCRGRAQVARPVPSPAGIASPGLARIGVVDLQAVSRVHPRWSELDAINKKLAEIEATLAAPPPAPPPVPQEGLRRQLEEQAKTLEAELRTDLEALQARQQEKLSRFAAQVKVEQEARFARRRALITQDLQNAVAVRVERSRAELRQYEDQVTEEYRYPIANLRLKADVVGVANEDELRKLTEDLERLLQERDAKVRARAEALDAAVEDFRKAREAEAGARLERAKQEVEQEIRAQVVARENELRVETDATARRRTAELQARLTAVRRELMGVAQGQLAAAQQRYVEGLRKRQSQLVAERQARQEQRVRLEDSILAEVKIEVATLAAARGLDVVLTRYTLNLAGEDLTREIIARIRRP